MGFRFHAFLSLLHVTITFFLIPKPSLESHLNSNGTYSNHLLNLIIRDYALKRYTNHSKTGFLYSVQLPENLSGVQADTARYRSGSLHRYGAKIKEFQLSPGVLVSPYAERLIVVRQRLGGNWSSIYNKQNISRFDVVSPLLGLLVYDAEYFNATNHKELEIVSAGNPITIDFSNVSDTTYWKNPRCAFFNLEGEVKLYNQTRIPNVCVGNRQGHYGLVMEKMQRPLRQEHMKKGMEKVSRWKMVIGTSVAGLLGAFLLGLLFVALVRIKKRSRIAEMERRAYEEEALQVSMVGHVRAPIAAGTRTLPALENDYTP